jgi:FixJ family two-component response regulator
MRDEQETTARVNSRPGSVSRAETVVIVDDDERVRRALARLIRSAGMPARTYPSAEAFLAEPPEASAGCLVVDLRLPGLNGLELQEALARRGLPISVVFISGHGDVPTSVRAMKAGAVDFLQKPFEDRELLEAIRRASAQTREALARGAERAEIRRRHATLTPREREVLVLVVAGLPNKLVASELGAAEKTIKIHRARVMEKMGAASLPDLVRMAGLLGDTARQAGPPEH